MPSGKNNNQSRIEELTVKLMELEEQLADKLWQRETEIKEVEAWIETLKPYQRNVIRLRYIEGRTWRQVQKRTHYTREGVMKINAAVKKGLKK